MKKNLLLSSLLICTGLIAESSLAERCPTFESIQNAPAVPVTKRSNFRKWSNNILTSLYSPFHMVHDTLVAEGETATMVGKFDYDWVLHKDLEGEDIEVYLFGTSMSDWEHLGTFRTDDDGKVYVPVSSRPVGHYLVRMVAKGDLSFATGFLSVVEPGTKAVLFDIDGTLTLSDFEGVVDYLGVADAQAYFYAPETVNAYVNKDYCVLYLSARPYWLMSHTRNWLLGQNIPEFHVHTNPNAELLEQHDAAVYKAEYINQLKASGLDIIRAYGNAETDIEAYANAGIPKSETYIIGDFAGDEETQALDGDYLFHYSTVVEATKRAE